ncbi:hypothetical protein MBRA1_000930 [Malassezia brasiliensis]|uniref:Uncharacterized protein n=1 Tax=Malassezia brasiliensis TaxID=1821822 RepID=A0AAF0DT58_9BASI|nr:hypothetical protein MBRA1_000930 [Malassezia brasiliensis]
MSRTGAHSMAHTLPGDKLEELPEKQPEPHASLAQRLRRAFRRTPPEPRAKLKEEEDAQLAEAPPPRDLGEITHTPKAMRKLQFANIDAARIHPEDLPQDYDPDDNYRGLDAYVNARRAERRRLRRAERRMMLANLHRRHAFDDELDSDDASSDSSSSSSEGPLGIARLRALFGHDSDSSSSSSGSDTSESDSDDTASVVSNTSRSIATDTDAASILSRRSRHARRDDNSVTDSPALSTALSVFTPRLSGARQTRNRRRVRRQRKRERKYMQKASRKARRNARRLREIAGGVTEYALYTPMAPGQDAWLTTESWNAVVHRWHDYFLYHQQLDGHAGDLGAPHETDMDSFVLPPPALDAPDEDNEFRPTNDDESWYDQERNTGRHMSDVPLAPFLADHTPSLPFTPRMVRTIGQSNTHTVDTIAEEDLGDLGEPLLGDPMLALPSKTPRSVAAPPPISELLPPLLSPPPQVQSNPWWLDIRCPTYKDMQELSTFFPLHPLTVEDILKQEPREKVETFDRLGYYFVVIRALDENYFKFTRADHNEGEVSLKQIEQELGRNQLYGNRHSDPEAAQQTGPTWEITKDVQNSKEGLEGLNAGSVSLYLVVFAHGVLSFHFEDVQKHLDNVRSRLENHVIPADYNADWIVHGIYDSVVDAFLPYVSFLQVQEGIIEALGNDLSVSNENERAASRSNDQQADLYRGMLKYLLPSSKKKKKKKSNFTTAEALRQSRFILRLSETREVVTGLFRLLTPKVDVLRGMKKRLYDYRGAATDENMILMYMDDIVDHLSLMVTQLQERDHALAHVHSIFLVSSRTMNKEVQLRMIRYLVIASSVATGTMLCQLSTSSFSMNVKVPADAQGDYTYDHYYPFGIIVAFIGIVPFIMYSYYRAVEKNARRKYERENARR